MRTHSAVVVAEKEVTRMLPYPVRLTGIAVPAPLLLL